MTLPLAAPSDGANDSCTRACVGTKRTSSQPSLAAAIPARTVRRTPSLPALSMPGTARWAMKASRARESSGGR
jgi:hypothetical protein